MIAVPAILHIPMEFAKYALTVAIKDMKHILIKCLMNHFMNSFAIAPIENVVTALPQIPKSLNAHLISLMDALLISLCINAVIAILQTILIYVKVVLLIVITATIYTIVEW